MTIFVQQFDCPTGAPTVAVKDTIDIAGWPTRAGSRALADAAPAAADAEVVRRLVAAGWAVAGKTTLHELAFGTTGINHWAGTPTNPRFPDHVPGGSSSGSAAAVAAGAVDAALGTDTGGSIRTPAACCGVFGLKPTFGRVSRAGVMPAATSLDCVGPFAADMDRLIACMTAICPDFGPLPAIDGVAIGIARVDADPRYLAAVDGAVARSGLASRPAELPGMAEAFKAGLTIINAETWAAVGALVAGGLVGEDVAVRLRAAANTSAADVAAAEQVRTRFTRAVDTVLADTPVIALPTMAGPPPLLGQAADTSRLVTITSLVRPFNLSGHPAIAVPLAPIDGAPASLQLVTAKGADELLCAVARHLAACLSPADQTA